MAKEEVPIAIVGYAYRAPGVTADQNLFDYLAEAKSAWTKFPTNRWDHDAYYHPTPEKAGTYAVQGAHFLTDDIYRFDASFFNLRAEEARAIDPQHRMLLECAFEAVDHAGFRLSDLAGSETGVFSALASSDYSQQMADDPNIRSRHELTTCHVDASQATSNWTATGTAPTMFANRLSYFFDLHGPSVVLDTACASSGYAVHLACQSLRSGECSQALVGGASLLIGPHQFTVLDTMGALSPQGRCYSYDHKATGFGRGEGAACMLLKPLDRALADGDPIQAVIRNSACNHSGRSDGITMPSRAAQVALLRKVHDEIGLSPSDSHVIEGHGTGTLAGDRVELGAFAEILAVNRSARDPLYVGSLKSNFGHLESASGILALTKVVLMVQQGYILPNADFEQLGPSIEGIEKLKVVTTPTPWPSGAPRRVVMTNFGFGGSNAAVIVEHHKSTERTQSLAHPPELLTNSSSVAVTNGVAEDNTHGISNGVSNSNGELESAHQKQPHHLVVLSAHSETSLASYSDALLKDLTGRRDTPSSFLRDLSFTLNRRRTQHAWRLALRASSVDELVISLSSTSRKSIKARHPLLAYIFTGQGAQYAQMAFQLWKFPVFASVMDEADRHLQAFGASWSLQDEICKAASDSRIDSADISQPACTALQLGLVSLLRSWGLVPSAVAGHSSGEIAAAFAAGILTIEVAMAVAYFRGQAAAQLTVAESSGPKGAMLALGVSEKEAIALIEQGVEGYTSIAAINSSRSVTVSGEAEAIETLQRIAEGKGLFCRRLKVNLAYHSSLMAPAAEAYREAIKQYCMKDPPSVQRPDGPEKPTFVSSVTGMPLDPKAINASYWVHNLLKTVRFHEATQSVQYLLEDAERTARRKGAHVLLELGPHSALKSAIQQTMSERQRESDSASASTYLSAITRGNASDGSMIELAGKLFCFGFPLDLGQVCQAEKQASRVITDLPRYAWDRSIRYVHGSRIAHVKSHPGAPYDSLLGWRIPSADGTEHVFRQMFTLDDIPWAREHKVNGAVIFPMTGYLAMAIAAARIVAAKAPSYLALSDVHTKRSLEITEDERIEMTTKLWPAATGTESVSGSAWAFKVSSWSEQRGWLTHCFGQIEPETDELTSDTPTLRRSLELAACLDREKLDAEAEYEGRPGVGTAYGAAYRTMQQFWKGDGWTEMESKLPPNDWYSLSSRFGSPITTDPMSLDAHLHGMGPFVGERADERPTLMPKYVGRLRISNKIPRSDDSRRLSIVTRIIEQDVKAGSTKVGVGVFDRTFKEGNDRPVLVPIAEWESVTFRSLSPAEDDPVANSRTLGIPHSFYWGLVPSLDFLDDEALAAMQESEAHTDQEIIDRRNLNNASLHYMAQALTGLEAPEGRADLPSLSKRFLGWASETIERCSPTGPAGVLMSQEALDAVAVSCARAELICAVGKQLVPILRGEVQPLQIMLKDNLLWRQYEEDTPTYRLSRVIGRHLNALLHTRGSLRVLEIGAGTGSATVPLLEEFTKNSSAEELGLIAYTYTDVSSGFFETARSKMAPWAGSISYKKLDISVDPFSQGFEAGDYDLVIAANVLHATADMSVTMGNVQQLLRPNGKLVLLEALVHAPLTMPFAILPGWWLSEDKYRDNNMGPLLSREVWNSLLTDSGFSGIDAAVHDFPGHADQVLGLMCTTKISTSQDAKETPITICGAIRDADEEQFADLVAEQAAHKLSCEAYVKPIAEWDPEDEPVCVILDSPKRSILQVDEMSSELYETIRQGLVTAQALLWVIPADRSPEHDVIRGILRSLRLEGASDRLLLLENVPWDESGVTVILDLVRRLQNPDVAKDLDQDFVVHDGKLSVPRLRPLETADVAFATATATTIRKVQPIWQNDAALELTVDTAGSPDYIYFRRNTAVLAGPLGDHEILIRNEAAGVNFRDLLVVLGSIPWTTPGYEGVGTVMRKGSKVTELDIGERVCYGSLSGGSYATCVRVPSWNTIKVPEHLSIEEAATISTPWTTAVMALINFGRLRKDESVLIHAASGGVGQACVVLAKHIGATIFATAGSADKRAFLHETMCIPEDHIFSSRTKDFRDSILAATNGQGVDVVVNSLSGKLLQESWSVIGDMGRFVEIGKKDILENSHLAMRHFERNVSFVGVDLRMLFERRPDELKDCLAKVADLLRRKIAVPIRPRTVYPISQLAAGLRRLQSGQNIGKVVITISPDDRVLAESAPHTQATGPLLRSDATYVITGGTGGIGRSLAPWMIDHGTRNVVLLGRSGGSNPEVARLLQQYDENPDVTIRAVACDVGSRDSLVQALHAIEDLPRVRGVVHGALWIRDAFLANSSYEDWQRTTTPKITAAWHLHELLPDLDFFVSLGSFLGAAGNVGQTIYSGTSSFLDAFTQYRNSQGLHSVSIALPIVLGVGYVADRAREDEMTERVGITLTEAQVQTLIEGAVRGPSSGLNFNGISSSFNIPPSVTLTGTWFHPRNLVRSIMEGGNKSRPSDSPGVNGSASAESNGAPLSLLDALIQKVSSMTMIDQKEMEPDAPLDTYGLDSLVSVELRNWIRRETGVELSLGEIGNAESLTALAGTISSSRTK